VVIEMSVPSGAELWLVCCLVFFGCTTVAGARKASADENSAIEVPIRDYVQGWYDKDTDRMAKGLHPDLAKRHMNPEATNGVEQLDLAQLLKLTPQYGGVKGDERRMDIKILDVHGDIASAMVTSNDYVDYMHLGRRNGAWQVINALWRFREGRAPAAGSCDAIDKPIHDYVEGWYDKDAERMAQGLHPDLTKRSMNPQDQNGVRKINLSQLLEIVPQYGGPGGDGRRIDITVLDVDQDMATVKVVSNLYVDYVQLGYWKGRWWVVNALWAFQGDT
jgi:hypothetical protein